MFKLDDIKPGYLLHVTDTKACEEINMTVVAGNGIGGEPELGCCCPGKKWCPLREFDAQLKYLGLRIDAVYGYTRNAYLLDNKTEYRKLLWERKQESVPIKMTVAQIQEKLGFKIEIISE